MAPPPLSDENVRLLAEGGRRGSAACGEIVITRCKDSDCRALLTSIDPDPHSFLSLQVAHFDIWSP